jgi:hypothetical protein
MDASTGSSTPPPSSNLDASTVLSPIRLASIDRGDYVGQFAFDAANVYAEIFSPISFNGNACGWKARWLRVAKDGSSSTELGDAASCELYSNRAAVALNGSLYWLGEHLPEGGQEVTSLMTMPLTGGTAQRLHEFPTLVENIGTDGTSLFAVTLGTSTNFYGDGTVLRLATDGTPTTLAEKQVAPGWVGITDGILVWSTATDCDIENSSCQSTTLLRMPTAGGAPELIVKRSGRVYPAHATAGAVFYYDGSEIERVALDGTVSPFAATPWNGGGTFSGIDELRVLGDEAIAGASVGTDNYLLAVPRAFDPPFVDFATFDVDDRLVYAQRDGGLERIPPP